MTQNAFATGASEAPDSDIYDNRTYDELSAHEQALFARSTFTSAPKQTRFVVYDTTIRTDARISAKAKGVWLVGVGHDLNLEQLTALCSDGAKSIYSALKELRAAGYLARTAERKGGKFTGWKYRFYEFPAGPIPPLCQNGEMVNPPLAVKGEVVDSANYYMNKELSSTASGAETVTPAADVLRLEKDNSQKNKRFSTVSNAREEIDISTEAQAIVSEVAAMRENDAVSMLFDVFPTCRLTPGKAGLIAAAVDPNQPLQLQAWQSTLELYQGNTDPARNKYMPEATGTMLNVYRDQLAKLATHQQGTQNGTNKNPNFRQQRAAEAIESRNLFERLRAKHYPDAGLSRNDGPGGARQLPAGQPATD